MNSKERYAEYLKTDYWKEVTDQVKKRAGWKCQICNSPHDLQAHHRTYDHRGKELDHLTDLICTCRRCHGIFHGVIKEIQPKPIKNLTRVEHKKKILPKSKDLMPEDEGPIVLTKELVVKCMTTHGGITTASFKPLAGSEITMKKGWIHRLIGRTLTREEYWKALEGRFIHA